MDRLEQTIANAEAFLSNVSDGTAITANDIRDVIDYLRELKNFKDASAKGLLWQFPCKPGDILYRVDTDERIKNKKVTPFVIDDIVIDQDGNVLFESNDVIICDLKCLTEGRPYLDFYKVFTTKEEAERVLEELHHDDVEREN